MMLTDHLEQVAPLGCTLDADDEHVLEPGVLRGKVDHRHDCLSEYSFELLRLPQFLDYLSEELH